MFRLDEKNRDFQLRYRIIREDPRMFWWDKVKLVLSAIIIVWFLFVIVPELSNGHLWLALHELALRLAGCNSASLFGYEVVRCR
jgi:uncharacterized membrane-anchored protein